MTDDVAKPGSSCWDSENMSNRDDRPVVRLFAVGESSEDFLTLKRNMFKLAVEVEQEGFTVRKAVFDCLDIEAHAEESAKVAGGRAAVAKRKAKRFCSSFEEAEHHRTTADKLSTAAKLTARRAKDFDRALQSAEMDAKSASQLAKNTYRDLNKTDSKLFDQDALEHLERAKEHAIRETTTLKKAEYLVLKAMQRCWESYLPPSEGDSFQEGDVNLTTPLNPRDHTDGGPTKWILMARAVILAIVGCIMFILSATLSISGTSFIVMLTTGAVCTLWSLCYIISKITQKIIAKRKLAYIHRRTAMLKFIGERLVDLTHFFTTEGITIPSDEEEEENPNIR